MSDGNGHPYSWSAICNGYSPVDMAACEFPVIPQYLSEQSWPEARLSDLEVSYVWTQDRVISDKIAKASLIPNIVGMPEEMIGKIDGLLLARDDAKNHLKIAAPFLKAGIPIYIDKPIALNIDALDTIYDLQKYDGQIFSCSALRFAKEFQLTPEQKNKMLKPEDLGETIAFLCQMPKHVCINQLTISPTWHRRYIAGLGLEKL